MSNLKALSLWAAAVLSSLAALAYVFLTVFSGEMRDVITALPKPDETSSYLLFSGKGATVPESFADRLMDLEPLSSCRSVGVISMVRLIPRSIKAAVLIEIKDGKTEIYGAFSFHRGVLGSLLSGLVPGSFRSIFDHPSLEAIWAEDIACFRLTSRCVDVPLYVNVDGGITLFSSSPPGLSSMKESLLRMKESPKPLWEVQPYWESHFKVNLPEASPDRLQFSGALKNDGRSGALAWKIDGLDISADKTARSWLPLPDLPRPLESAIAISDAKALGPFIESKSEGPYILAFGGKASALSLPFTGLALSKLDSDQGDLLEALLDDVSWDLDLEAFSLDLRQSRGYTASPLSLVWAFSDGISTVGLLESQDLGKTDSYDLKAALPEGWEDSFSWGFIKGPYIAAGLESLVKVGRMVFQGGDSGPPLPDAMKSLVALTRQMRKIPNISFVMPEIDRGLMRWN